MDPQKLQNDLKEARKRIAILEESLRAAKFEIVRLEDANSRLLSNQTASKLDGPRVSTLESENEQLREQVNELQQRIEATEEERLKFMEQIALLQADNGILSKDVMELTETVNELTGLAEAEVPDPTVGMVEDGQLKKPRFVPYEQYENVAALLAEYQDDDINAETKTAQIKELVETNQRLESTVAALKLVQEKSSTWEDSLCKAESRITELEVLLADAERHHAEYDNMKAQYEEMEKQCLRYQAGEAAHNQRLTEFDDARNALVASRNELELYKQRLAAAEDEVQGLRDELTRLQHSEIAAEDAVNRIKELEEMHSKLADDYTQSVRAVASLREVETEVKRLRTENEAQRARLLIAEDQVNRVVSENERLERLKEDQAAEMNKLYEAKRLYEYMKERFEPIKAEMERLRAKERNYAHIFATVDATNSKNDQRYKELEDLKREELKKRDDTIQTLKNEKLKLNEEIINLKANLHLREEEYRRASARVMALESSLANAAGGEYVDEDLKNSNPMSVRLSSLRATAQARAAAQQQ